MALFHLQNDMYVIFDDLLNSEFERKPTRVYFELSDLVFRGEKINVAIPLRANINKNFQKEPNLIIQTLPTEHTRGGFVAGWHIVKMIPFDREFFYKNRTEHRDYILAETIAKAFLEELNTETQKLLNRIEANEAIFGAINFDDALMAMRNAKIDKHKPTNP